MPFSDILGQTEAVEALRRLLRAGRVPHAFLFTGKRGVGKTRTAIEFAKALNCEARAGRPADGPGSGVDDACGACLSCRKMAHGNHPDLHIYYPIPSSIRSRGGDGAGARAAAPANAGAPARPGAAPGRGGGVEEGGGPVPEGAGGREGLRLARESKEAAWRRSVIESLSEDPFFVVSYEEAASLGIDDVRDLLHESSRRAVEGRYKVFLLSMAERLTEEAMNALLKVLEEPPPGTVLVLATSQPERILPTLHSRSRRIRFGDVPVPAIETVLRERDAGNPALAASLANGSLSKALSLAAGDVAADRDRAVETLDFPRTDPGFHGRVEELLAGNDRAAISASIDFMELWLADLLRARVGGDALPLRNADRAEEIRRLAGGTGVEEIRRRAEILASVRRGIEGNQNLKLLLYTALYAVERGEESVIR